MSIGSNATTALMKLKKICAFAGTITGSKSRWVIAYRLLTEEMSVFKLAFIKTFRAMLNENCAFNTEPTELPKALIIVAPPSI